MELEILEKFRHLSATKWSAEWSLRLKCMNDSALLAHGSTVYGVSFSRSNINHASSGMRWFVKKASTTGETIGYYYGTLVYKSMYAYGRKEKSGEGVMAFCSSACQKYAFYLKTKVRFFGPL